MPMTHLLEVGAKNWCQKTGSGFWVSDVFDMQFGLDTEFFSYQFL